MQSALDAKAFAAVSESIAQLLLLKESLCSSGLRCSPSAACATPHGSGASHQRTPGVTVHEINNLGHVCKDDLLAGTCADARFVAPQQTLLYAPPQAATTFPVHNHQELPVVPAYAAGQDYPDGPTQHADGTPSASGMWSGPSTAVTNELGIVRKATACITGDLIRCKPPTPPISV